MSYPVWLDLNLYTYTPEICVYEKGRLWQDCAEILPAVLQRLARILKFCIEIVFYTVPFANNKGADQPALMRRLVCAFFVGMQQSQVFSSRGSIVHVYIAIKVW